MTLLNATARSIGSSSALALATLVGLGSLVCCSSTDPTPPEPANFSGTYRFGASSEVVFDGNNRFSARRGASISNGTYSIRDDNKLVLVDGVRKQTLVLAIADLKTTRRSSSQAASVRIRTASLEEGGGVGLLEGDKSICLIDCPLESGTATKTASEGDAGDDPLGFLLSNALATIFGNADGAAPPPDTSGKSQDSSSNDGTTAPTEFTRTSADTNAVAAKEKGLPSVACVLASFTAAGAGVISVVATSSCTAGAAAMAPAGGLAVGVAACPQVAMAGYTATGLLAVRAVVTCSDGSSQEIPRPRELEGVSVLASVSGAVQSVINQAISFLSISARFGCNPMGMLSGRPT